MAGKRVEVIEKVAKIAGTAAKQTNKVLKSKEQHDWDKFAQSFSSSVTEQEMKELIRDLALHSKELNEEKAAFQSEYPEWKSKRDCNIATLRR